jgi:hypothetical protein
MKVELIRTDEENQRYNQLIQTNRQRRQELNLHENQPFKIPKVYNKNFINKFYEYFSYS